MMPSMQVPLSRRASAIGLNARILLVALIYASPGIDLFDGPAMQGLLAGYTALGIFLLAHEMRPGEADYFLFFARRAVPLIAFPLLWIFVQLLPIAALAHPIWTSAEIAIGHPIWGSISVDTGASVLAMGKYSIIAAVGLWSAAIALDRQRAETMLLPLAGAATLSAIGMPFMRLLQIFAPSLTLQHFQPAEAFDCAGMGVIIPLAGIVQILERYKSHRQKADRTSPVMLRAFTIYATAFSICVAVLLLMAPAAYLLAVGYGVIIIIAIVCIRRLAFGPWGIAAVLATMAFISIVLVASGPSLRTTSPWLAFAAAAPLPLLSTAEHMLEDAPIWGVGAGAFGAIAPIYREFGDQFVLTEPPTAAAEIAVELGRPMLWLILITFAGAAVILVRASLRRGRDSFYPMAGAASIITLSLLSVMNAGTLGTSAVLLLAATLGLAVAQSKSQMV
jgi:hypothetical protein